MLENRMVKIQLTKEKLLSIVEKIKNVRVGVIGDGCLDIYWDADMRLSELSRETPHYPLPVIKERMYPGGGTNVAVNAKSLGSPRVYMLSLIGKDWRGDCLISKLAEENVNTWFMLSDDNRITPAYCKPMRRGYSHLVYEDPRIDFENRIPLTKEEEANIIKSIHEMSENIDVIAVCDQFKYGIINERVRKELEKLALQGKKIVADSRSRIGRFRHVIVKPNEMEAMAAVHNGNIPDKINHQIIMETASKLYQQNKAPVIITMGSHGSLWYEGEGFYLAEGISVEPPIDIVGAGDAFLAAFSCAYGAGFAGPEAIAFANMVSSVVIKKIGMAGTATPDEVVDQMERVKYL